MPAKDSPCPFRLAHPLAPCCLQGYGDLKVLAQVQPSAYVAIYYDLRASIRACQALSGASIRNQALSVGYISLPNAPSATLPITGTFDGVADEQESVA